MRRCAKEIGCLAVAAALLTAASPAMGQEPGASGPEAQLAGAENPPPSEEDLYPLTNAPRVYYPEEFERFAPRNALDLIEQIPGFNIEGGGGGGRGFGEASGNLLINGDRISSKSTSTRDQLSRIPVDNVIRIEVVDGSTLEIPGLSGRVANIIAESGGISGQFSWRPQVSTGPASAGWTEGEVSVSGGGGSVDYTVALESGAFQRGSSGPAVFINGAGDVDERFNTSSARFNQPTLSGNFTFDVAPRVVANLNLSGGLTIFRSREEEHRVEDNSLPDFLERFRTTNDEYFYEFSGDIEFPVGPGRLKLIALESFEDGDFVTRSLLDVGAVPVGGTRYARDSRSGERIGRGEYSWGMWGADWQLSAEAAFNRLDQVAQLFGYVPEQEEFVEIPFPAGVGGVREERYETILSFGRPIAGNLSLQLTAGGEYSTISQTGVNALSRTFKRPKGSIQLAWTPMDSLDISARAVRRVGQLDFGDFLASVDVTEDNQSAGNNQLRPQQSWEFEAEGSKTFGRWGSATLTLFDYRIEDLLLIVPVPGGGEARGNIASARRYGVRLNGTLEMEPMGIAGAKLDVNFTAEDSNLLDPVTRVERRFDAISPREIRLDFRHDIPATDYAWGLEFRDTQNALAHRVAETSLTYNIPTFGAVFVEHKDVLGLTTRLRVGNLFNGSSLLVRTVYDGPRNEAPVLFVEDKRTKIGQVFNLSISGSF